MRAERVALRPAQVGDIPFANALHADGEATWLLGYANRPAGPIAVSSWLDQLGRADDAELFTVVQLVEPLGATPIGFVWFEQISPRGNANVSIAFFPRVKARYYVDVAGLAGQWAFLRQGLHRLTAPVLAGNDGASKWLKFVGFELEGVLKEARYAAGCMRNVELWGAMRRDVCWIPDWEA